MIVGPYCDNQNMHGRALNLVLNHMAKMGGPGLHRLVSAGRVFRRSMRLTALLYRIIRVLQMTSNM